MNEQLILALARVIYVSVQRASYPPTKYDGQSDADYENAVANIILTANSEFDKMVPELTKMIGL